MTSLSSKMGKVAAGALVAGALALGGAGAANAEDTAPVDSIDIVIGDGTDDGSNWTPPPAPGPGDLPDGESPVVEIPEPEAPTEEVPPTIPALPPTAPAEDNTPGKSAGHRAATPQQALDNNQSHKHDTKHENKKSQRAFF